MRSCSRSPKSRRSRITVCSAVLLLIGALTVVLALSACTEPFENGTETSTENDSTSATDTVTEAEPSTAPVTEPETVPETLSPAQTDPETAPPEPWVELTPNAKDSLEYTYSPLPEERMAGVYKVQDLGTLELENYPSSFDNMYDWGACIMKDGDIYRMWWCRQCPFDTMWYAESTDMKTWVNEQMVLKIDRDSDWIKAMLGWPDVVKVDGTYYMYFEAPEAVNAAGGEYNNNIFLATSTDGIHFTMYPSNEDPQPVIRTPEDIAERFHKEESGYGVGQPDVFYKDGYFWVYYTDAATRSNQKHQNWEATRLAKSTDGIHFEGTVREHPFIFDRAGAAVRYNSITDTFYLTCVINTQFSDPERPSSDEVYIMESKDGVHFPYDTMFRLGKEVPAISLGTQIGMRSTSDFAVNPEGIIDTETMYLINTLGDVSHTADFRSGSGTWDGYLTAVNPTERVNAPIRLPNGTESSAEALQVYYDRVTKWKQPTLAATYGHPTVDGSMDSAWRTVTPAHMNTVPTVGDGNTPTLDRATVRFMWDENGLYFLVLVKDEAGRQKLLAEANGPITLEIFFNGMTAVDGTKINSPFSGKRVCLYQDGRKRGVSSSALVPTEDGYCLEGCIDWSTSAQGGIGDGATILVDMLLDAITGPDRSESVSRLVWSDYEGKMEASAGRFGSITLRRDE